MRQVTHALLTRPPLSHSSFRGSQSASFDLHVLGTPPAFILSQDQTLVKKVCIQFRIAWQFCSCLLFLVRHLNVCSELFSLKNFQGLCLLSIVQLSMFILFSCRFRDSHIRLSHLSSLVNNFFNLFFLS